MQKVVAMSFVLIDFSLYLNITENKINRFLSSFNRPNLRYSVIAKKGKNCSDETIAMIKSKWKNECGIVYCFSRNDCDSYAEQMRSNGMKALAYHAGLSDGVRSEVQAKWVSEEVNSRIVL